MTRMPHLLPRHASNALSRASLGIFGLYCLMISNTPTTACLRSNALGTPSRFSWVVRRSAIWGDLLLASVRPHQPAISNKLDIEDKEFQGLGYHERAAATLISNDAR